MRSALLLAMSLCLSASAEDAIEAHASLDSHGAIVFSLSTALPENACVVATVHFEQELAVGTATAAYVGKDGTAAFTLGPWAGRSLLRGTYQVRASVDPTNQDPRVQGWFQEHPKPITATSAVEIGGAEEAKADRKLCSDWLQRLVEECCGVQKQARAAYDDLLAGKRFSKGGGNQTLDTALWDQAMHDLLQAQVKHGDEHEKFVGSVLVPYYPSLMLSTARSLVGNLALLLREYANQGYVHYHLKPPSEYMVKALIKPDRSNLEMMFNRDCRSVLQGIGQVPLRPLSEVVLSGTKVPAGLTLSTVPKELSEAIDSNPATLSQEAIKKVKDWSALAPGLDLAGASQIYWMRTETQGDERGTIDAWLVAYDSPERRTEAEARLAHGIPETSADRHFGGEQFLCWMHVTGDVDPETYGKFQYEWHCSLGW